MSDTENNTEVIKKAKVRRRNGIVFSRRIDKSVANIFFGLGRWHQKSVLPTVIL